MAGQAEMRAPLLPCPLCGRDARVTERPQSPHDPHKFACFVACHGGGYSAHVHVSGFADTPEEARNLAMAEWNKRPISRSPAAPAGGVEAAVKRLQTVAADLTEDGNAMADQGDVRAEGLYIYAREVQAIHDTLAAAATRATQERRLAVEMREAAAKTADGFTCGLCGMDGKAGAAIRALPIPGEEPTP